MLPDSTRFREIISIFGIPEINFAFGGNYFLIYSLGLSAFGAVVEIINMLFYAGMIIGFRRFINGNNSASPEIRRMKMGVLRTTLAAMCTSLGSWIIAFFFATTYTYMFITGETMVTDEEFNAIFGLLNAINNVLTPWVLLIAFPKRVLRFARAYSRFARAYSRDHAQSTEKLSRLRLQRPQEGTFSR